MWQKDVVSMTKDLCSTKKKYGYRQRTNEEKSNTNPGVFLEIVNPENFVAVLYGGLVYVGKVLEIDKEIHVSNCKITSTENAKRLYRWLRP